MEIMVIASAWLKKRRKAGAQQEGMVCNNDAIEQSSSTVMMNDQYKSSTTSLKNSVEDANKKSYEYEAYYDSQSHAEQDDAPLDDSLSTVKMSELPNSSRLNLIHEALQAHEQLLGRRTRTKYLTKTQIEVELVNDIV